MTRPRSAPSPLPNGPRVGRALSLGLVWALAAGALPGCATAPSPRRAAAAAERPYSLQMHLHAHSNHNGSSHPASMQWHTWFARESGTDILWWTEHVGAYARADTFRIVPAGGSIDSSTLAVSVAEGRQSSEVATYLKERVLVLAPDASGIARAFFDGDYLYQEATGAPGAEAASHFYYSPVGERGLVRSMSLARQVATGAVAEADVDLGDRDDTRRAALRFLLSWHHYGRPVQYEIRVLLVPPGEPAVTMRLDEGTVLVREPCPSGRSTVTVDLARAAALLRDGDDATVSNILWGVEAAGSGTVRLGLRAIRLWTRHAGARSGFALARRIAERYEKEYGVVEELGGEYAWRGIHLNAFFPDSVLPATRTARDWDPRDLGTIPEWVASVHAHGGVVSLNHPFGTQGPEFIAPESEQRERAHALARDYAANRAFGADILEVGYVQRGEANLAAHLLLWDLLTANGCYLYGNGTSDSHGGPWFDPHVPNRFETWVWAEGPSPEALLRGMRAGRLFFGDRSLWNGAFDVLVGPHRAGDRVPAVAGDLPVEVRVEPWPPGARVLLVQGRAVPGETAVDYVHDRTPLPRDGRATVRVDGPCFVRVEVEIVGEGGESVPLLFSNPIVFTAPGAAARAE